MIKKTKSNCHSERSLYKNLIRSVLLQSEPQDSLVTNKIRAKIFARVNVPVPGQGWAGTHMWALSLSGVLTIALSEMLIYETAIKTLDISAS